MSKWDARFLALAAMVGSWSKEEKSRVGCVIVDDKRRIISTGYNGFPRGVSDDIRMVDRDVKLAHTIHAEENALLFAGRSVAGCTAYVNRPPCSLCAAKLIQCGIKRIVFLLTNDAIFNAHWQTSMMYAERMCVEAGVEYIPHDHSTRGD